MFWFVIFLFAGFFISKNWWVKDYLIQIYYDIQYQNVHIEKKREVDQILSEFEVVSYENLEEEYLNYTLSNKPKFKKMLEGSIFYLLNRKDVNRKIVGDLRIKDFMSKDKYYKDLFSGKQEHVKWLMDKKILYSVLDLQIELAAKGYKPGSFSIASGHRTPIRNQQVGGASLSRHIKGQAVDLKISDINGDGVYSNVDKEIVLHLVNQKIIAQRGGVGRYPGSRIVHIDVRGYHARWDTY